MEPLTAGNDHIRVQPSGIRHPLRKRLGMLVVLASSTGACDRGETREASAAVATDGVEGSRHSQPEAPDPAAEARSRNRFEAALKVMSDAEYPDDPDIDNRSARYGAVRWDKLRLQRLTAYRFDLTLVPADGRTPEIVIKDVDLGVFTPQAPRWLRQDDYLTYIGLINQEWNRQQIDLRDRFEVKSEAPEWEGITRVDVARNCLNAGLWEVIVFYDEAGDEKLLYHGWFDFPEPLYAAMFEDVTGIPFREYAKPLKDWIDPEQKVVDLSVLREPLSETKVSFEVRNAELYPLVGEQKKKYRNILSPERPKTIDAMLDDATTFATFDQPGFYNAKNPRKTHLGRLAKAREATLRKVDPAAIDEPRHELVLRFTDREGKRTTQLVVGGLDLTALPRLQESEHDRAHKMPMGIANHSFYETYAEALARPVERNPYYAMLLDGEGKWIDSHDVGIDGPLFHWDAERPDVLHLYILAFERHGFVGHFELKLPESARGS